MKFIIKLTIILACLFLISTNIYGQAGSRGSFYVATARTGTLFVDVIKYNDSTAVLLINATNVMLDSLQDSMQVTNNLTFIRSDAPSNSPGIVQVVDSGRVLLLGQNLRHTGSGFIQIDTVDSWGVAGIVITGDSAGANLDSSKNFISFIYSNVSGTTAVAITPMALMRMSFTPGQTGVQIVEEDSTAGLPVAVLDIRGGLNVRDSIWLGDADKTEYLYESGGNLYWYNGASVDTLAGATISAGKDSVRDTYYARDTLYVGINAFTQLGKFFRSSVSSLRYVVNNNSGGDSTSVFQADKLIARKDTLQLGSNATQFIYVTSYQGKDSTLVYKTGASGGGSVYDLLAAADSSWASITTGDINGIEPTVAGAFIDLSQVITADRAHRVSILDVTLSAGSDTIQSDGVGIDIDIQRTLGGIDHMIGIRSKISSGGGAADYRGTGGIFWAHSTLDTSTGIQAWGKSWAGYFGSDTLGDGMGNIFVGDTIFMTNDTTYIHEEDDTLKFSDGTTEEYIVKDTLNAVVEMSYIAEMPNTIFDTAGFAADSVNIRTRYDSVYLAAGENVPVYEFSSEQINLQYINMMVTFPIPYDFESWAGIYISAGQYGLSGNAGIGVIHAKNWGSRASDSTNGMSGFYAASKTWQGITTTQNGLTIPADSLNKNTYTANDVLNLRLKINSKKGAGINSNEIQIHRIWFRYYKKEGM